MTFWVRLCSDWKYLLFSGVACMAFRWARHSGGTMMPFLILEEKNLRHEVLGQVLEWTLQDGIFFISLLHPISQGGWFSKTAFSDWIGFTLKHHTKMGETRTTMHIRLSPVLDFARPRLSVSWAKTQIPVGGVTAGNFYSAITWSKNMDSRKLFELPSSYAITNKKNHPIISQREAVCHIISYTVSIYHVVFKSWHTVSARESSK